MPYLPPRLAPYHAFILFLPRLATCHVVRVVRFSAARGLPRGLDPEKRRCSARRGSAGRPRINNYKGFWEIIFIKDFIILGILRWNFIKDFALPSSSPSTLPCLYPLLASPCYLPCSEGGEVLCREGLAPRVRSRESSVAISSAGRATR